MSPLPRVLSGIVGAAVFVLVAVLFAAGGATRGPLRIDEAHKIADTFFFRLLLERDFSHPAWSAHIVDRTNPPVGKFLFGFAAWLQGAPLAESLDIRMQNPDGSLGQELRQGAWPRYHPTLLAARRASLLVTALTAACLAIAAARLHGFVAALVVAVLYALSHLPQTFAGTAVYDPILAFAAAATIASAVPFIITPPVRASVQMNAAAAGGLFAAMAFQTRLSGLLVLGALCGLLAMLALVRRSRVHLYGAGVAAAVCALASYALNPFYWRAPLRAFATQLSDLQALLAQQHRFEGAAAKLSFAWEVLAGDLAGLVLIFGSVLGVIFLAPNGARDRRVFAAIALWSLLLAGATIAWLPVPWPRYLLLANVPLALLAAFGWSEMLGQIVSATRARRDGRTQRSGS